MNSSVTGIQTMHGLGYLMGMGYPPEGESRPLLTAVEAALLVLAAFFLASCGLLSWWRGSGGESLLVWFAASTIPAAVLLVGGALVAGRFRLRLHHRGDLRGFGLLCLGAGLLGVAGGQAIGLTRPELLAPLLGRGGQDAWALLWVCIAAPLIEEFYFRGVLQGALGRHTGGPVTVVLVALAFMLVHCGMPNLVLWFLIGLGLSILRQASGSVIPAMVGHIAWNLGTVFLARDSELDFMAMEMAVFGIVLTVAGGVIIAHGGKQPSGRPPEA